VHEALARVCKRTKLIEIAQPESMEGRLKTESTAPSPKQEVLSRTMRIVLERAVDRLPESNRFVFMLRELEGMTTAEPPRVSGFERGVGKGSVFTARSLLRSQLQLWHRARPSSDKLPDESAADWR
jgi:DNA-directed RNA polymerase specialized sigma24 family protein